MGFLASLGVDAWVTIGVVIGLVAALVSDWGRPDLVMLSGVSALLVGGVVTPEQAFAGFSNSAVLTVGALYVVAAGVQHTDALARLDRLLFTKAARLSPLLARFMVPTAVLSGLLNNTPIVAMLTPRLQEWADEQGVPASKLRKRITVRPDPSALSPPARAEDQVRDVIPEEAGVTDPVVSS